MEGVGLLSRTTDSHAAGRAEAQALVVADDDPATIYLVLAGMGVIVSHDSGLTWRPLRGGLRHGGVHALTFDRRSGNYLLAATDQGIWRFPLRPATR